MATTGHTKSSAYAMASAGKFAKPIAVILHVSAWAESAVLRWVQNRINGGAQ